MCLAISSKYRFKTFPGLVWRPSAAALDPMPIAIGHRSLSACTRPTFWAATRPESIRCKSEYVDRATKKGAKRPGNRGVRFGGGIAGAHADRGLRGRNESDPEHSM